MGLEFANDMAKKYFDSMPSAIQEMIMQDGIKIESVDQLKAIEENFSKKCRD